MDPLTLLGLGVGFNAVGTAGGLTGSILNLVSQKRAQEQNLALVRETNAVNRQNILDTNAVNKEMVQMTNQANAEQAELAYKRSMPYNQVQNMMAAGMSKPAALAALSGGGSYSAPVMQSATMQAPQNVAGHVDAPQFNNVDFNALADRISQLPGNAEQIDLLKQQINNLVIEGENMRKAEIRAQELHEIAQFEHTYGKQLRAAVDDIAAYCVNYAADHDINLDDIDSPQKLVSMFHLNNNDTWRDMPAAGRKLLFDNVRLQAQENRTNLFAQDSHRAADDAHNAAIDALKNSEFGRTLTSKQIDKIDRELQVLQQQIDSYDASADARAAENNAREIRAKFESLASSFGLSMAELRKDFYFDQDGKPKLHTLRSVRAKEFWDMVSKVIGLDTIGDSVIGKLFK